MRAFRILEPGKTGLVEISQPAAATDEVLLRVRVVGFCGSDLSTFRGLNPLVSYPRIPGHEIAGVIAACGTEVPEEWAVGTAVTLSPYSACGAPAPPAASGAFPTDALVTQTVPLAEAGDALAQWAADPACVTKILVEVG